MDEYLYCPAPKEILREKYPYLVSRIEENEKNAVPEPTGMSGFIAKWFGVELLPSRKLEEYERNKAMQYQLGYGQAILDGVVYPGRLGPFFGNFQFTLGSPCCDSELFLAELNYDLLHDVLCGLVLGR